MTHPITQEAEKAMEWRTVLELIEVDLTAGNLPDKTRVALALHRIRAALSQRYDAVLASWATIKKNRDALRTENDALQSRVEKLEAGLRIIARYEQCSGYGQCLDNFMSDQDIARALLPATLDTKP